jgi:hypothetical protein
MKNYLTIIIVLVLVYLLCGCGSGISAYNGVQYQEVTVRGITHYVVIDKKYNSDGPTLRRIGEQVCNSGMICYAWFYNEINTAMAASGTGDATYSIASYGFNKNTGYLEFMVCALGDC